MRRYRRVPPFPRVVASVLGVLVAFVILLLVFLTTANDIGDGVKLVPEFGVLLLQFLDLVFEFGT